MNGLKIVAQLLKHPLAKQNKINALIRFLRWQAGTKLIPFPVVYPFVENSVLIQKKGRTGSTGNIYTGLHEFKDMAFLLHLLRPEDLFLDIGANVGSYSVLAGKVVGATVIAVEPIPATYTTLLQNIKVNSIEDQVIGLNIGLGSKAGTINFTRNLDTTNHVISSNELTKDTVAVEVNTLDRILQNQDPTLIKIDVEGFEKEVLAGGTKTLASSELKAIIIELNGSGQRYGFNDQDIHNLLLRHNFNPFDYAPFTKSLIPQKSFGSHNTIYIRDLNWVKQRIQTSRKFNILDIMI